MHSDRLIQLRLSLLGMAAIGALMQGLGCDFFQELESETDGVSTDGTSTGTPVDTEAVDSSQRCEPSADRCLDQDTVRTCNDDTRTIEQIACTELCGTNDTIINMTCVRAPMGDHGCYCADAGPVKLLTCTELESCVGMCPSSQGDCADRCFAQTNASTIRLFGALLFCATDSCHDACEEDPDGCGMCIRTAVERGQGACGLPRSVCDLDELQNLWGPFG